MLYSFIEQQLCATEREKKKEEKKFLVRLVSSKRHPLLFCAELEICHRMAAAQGTRGAIP